MVPFLETVQVWLVFFWDSVFSKTTTLIVSGFVLPVCLSLGRTNEIQLISGRVLLNGPSGIESKSALIELSNISFILFFRLSDSACFAASPNSSKLGFNLNLFIIILLYYFFWNFWQWLGLGIIF